MNKKLDRNVLEDEGFEFNRGVYTNKNLKGYLCLININGSTCYQWNIGQIEVCYIDTTEELHLLLEATKRKRPLGIIINN